MPTHMDYSMFDTLLQLPLFQGLSLEDLTNILAKVKLQFVKWKAGATIAQKDEPCTQLTFILKGKISVSTPATNQLYQLTESYEAPYLIEPQAMFGMYTHYVSSYTAEEATDTVSISKIFVSSELFKYEIFRLNYINIISNRTQTLRSRLWTPYNGDVGQRIIHFIANRVERPYGKKQLKIKMEDLARIVNDTRLNVSHALNAMQDNGLVELHRGEIIIPRLEDLIG